MVVRKLGERQAPLPLAAALAVCEACEASAPVRCAIKWPNDVWIDRRKVAGILVEGRPQEGWAVLGVGINVATSEAEFPPELRATATSLAIAGGGPAGDALPSVEAVLASVLARFEQRLEDAPPELLAAWRDRDALRGGRVRWGGDEGIAEGISETGALLVSTDRGQVALAAGEVHLTPAAGNARSR